MKAKGHVFWKTDKKMNKSGVTPTHTALHIMVKMEEKVLGKIVSVHTSNTIGKATSSAVGGLSGAQLTPSDQ